VFTDRAGAVRQAVPHAVITTAPGEESQVDYGDGLAPSAGAQMRTAQLADEAKNGFAQ